VAVVPLAVDALVDRARHGPVQSSDISDVAKLRRQGIGVHALRPYQDAQRIIAEFELRWREDDPAWEEHLRGDWRSVLDGLGSYRLRFSSLPGERIDSLLRERELMLWLQRQLLQRFVVRHRLAHRKVTDHDLRLLGRRLGHHAVREQVLSGLCEADAARADRSTSDWDDLVREDDAWFRSLPQANSLDEYRRYIGSEVLAFIAEGLQLGLLDSPAAEQIEGQLVARLPHVGSHLAVLELLDELSGTLPILKALRAQEALRNPQAAPFGGA
jgi:hypothetical protein